MLRQQFRPFRERGIKNRRVWSRDEQPGGIALCVALYFATGWIWRVLRVTARAQRRLVQQRTAIEMQNEDWRVRRGLVDFFERWHPVFGELKFAPTTDHPNPLAGRCAFG